MSSVTTVSGPRVIVALDYPTASEALAFAARVTPELCRLKVGFELFTSAGPEVVSALKSKGYDVFLDLKYHDIPNTVAKACAAAARLGVWMVNVHTLGGRDMLRAARAAIDNSAQRPLLIGVTLLTSHSANDLAAIGLHPDPEAQSIRLAEIANEAGLDGVVCSAQEAAALRSTQGTEFCLVTPGIRLTAGVADDQQRVMTPVDALRAGAHYLVIGRPVTQSTDPRAVLTAVNQDLHAVS